VAYPVTHEAVIVRLIRVRPRVYSSAPADTFRLRDIEMRKDSRLE
jgi:hypothetical protein